MVILQLLKGRMSQVFTYFWWAAAVAALNSVHTDGFYHQVVMEHSENTHYWWKDHCTPGLQFNKAWSYQTWKYGFFRM